MAFLQTAAIIVMIALTYVLFQAFGAPRKTLLFTRQDKEQFDASLRTGLGSWFTQTNIFGTITLFATVYLFFIGSSKLFGYWVFWTVVMVWVGGFVTNAVTVRIRENPHVAELLRSPDQVGGVIASLFWRNSTHAKQTAALVKWLSLFNIAATIWLDFALFADISGRLLGANLLIFKLAVLGFCCLTIFYFTARYGLRGFVFADLFQSPMILLAILVLLFGSVMIVVSNPRLLEPAVLFHPLLPQALCVLFALQVTFLNTFSILTTEPHWLRLWAFGQREIDLQVRAISITAVSWVLLALVGLVASQVSNGRFGEDAVVGLFTQLNKISPIFIVAFWIGGVAALFSSADAQIYSILIVGDFDLSTGRLKQRLTSSIKPLRLSLFFAAGFLMVYFLVRHFNIPLEKLIFIIVPFSLNVLPAFTIALLRREQHPWYIALSVGLYMICAVLGLLQPAQQFAWTLAAALMPVFVSLLTVLIALTSSSGRAEHVGSR